MNTKATAGHLAADIRRAAARLDRVVILWGSPGVPVGSAPWWPHIERACSGVVWAKQRALRWEKRGGHARCLVITRALRDANASITRAGPFLTEL
jgi:hypothetical protein